MVNTNPYSRYENYGAYNPNNYSHCGYSPDLKSNYSEIVAGTTAVGEVLTYMTENPKEAYYTIDEAVQTFTESSVGAIGGLIAGAGGIIVDAGNLALKGTGNIVGKEWGYDGYVTDNWFAATYSGVSGVTASAIDIAIGTEGQSYEDMNPDQQRLYGVTTTTLDVGSIALGGVGLIKGGAKLLAREGAEAVAETAATSAALTAAATPSALSQTFRSIAESFSKYIDDSMIRARNFRTAEHGSVPGPDADDFGPSIKAGADDAAGTGRKWARTADKGTNFGSRIWGTLKTKMQNGFSRLTSSTKDGLNRLNPLRLSSLKKSINEEVRTELKNSGGFMGRGKAIPQETRSEIVRKALDEAPDGTNSTRVANLVDSSISNKGRGLGERLGRGSATIAWKLSAGIFTTPVKSIPIVSKLIGGGWAGIFNMKQALKTSIWAITVGPIAMDLAEPLIPDRIQEKTDPYVDIARDAQVSLVKSGIGLIGEANPDVSDAIKNNNFVGRAFGTASLSDRIGYRTNQELAELKESAAEGVTPIEIQIKSCLTTNYGLAAQRMIALGAGVELQTIPTLEKFIAEHPDAVDPTGRAFRDVISADCYFGQANVTDLFNKNSTILTSNIKSDMTARVEETTEFGQFKVSSWLPEYQGQP